MAPHLIEHRAKQSHRPFVNTKSHRKIGKAARVVELEPPQGQSTRWLNPGASRSNPRCWEEDTHIQNMRKHTAVTANHASGALKSRPNRCGRKANSVFPTHSTRCTYCISKKISSIHHPYLDNEDNRQEEVGRELTRAKPALPTERKKYSVNINPWERQDLTVTALHSPAHAHIRHTSNFSRFRAFSLSYIGVRRDGTIFLSSLFIAQYRDAHSGCCLS